LNEKSSKLVTHNIFGEGIVLETRWNGTETRVKFINGLSLWLPTKWLKPIRLIDEEEIKLDEISSKRILEAFRMGIVPHQDIELFTFGRENEIEILKRGLNNLKNGISDVCVIEGSYGSGKSHLLEYFRHLALKEGFATTYCELHVQETPPFRPKKVYHELVYNLHYIRDNYDYSFRDILKEATEKLKITDHCFFTPVLKRVKEIDGFDPQSEVFYQWIEGESTKDYATSKFSPYRVRGGQAIPALYDFSTAADFYSYILSGLSYIVRKLNLGGLVMIIDEFEEVTHIWNYELYKRGLNFMNGLIGVSLNDGELRKVDYSMMHNQVRPTPYAYKEPYIFLVLATTPLKDLKFTDEIRNKISLRKFNLSDFEFIFGKLLGTYRSAYKDFNLNSSLYNSILNAALEKSSLELRDFIKFCIDSFDWVRLKKF
jgi:hypothetical protein